MPTLATVLILLMVPLTAAAQPAGHQPSPIHGDAALGAQLFSGAVPFSRGGPACAHCHDVAALPRPGGGTMGPDLTNVYADMGAEGVLASVQTLFFPTMLPLFSSKPLTPDEQNASAAFLESTNGRPPRGAGATLSLGGAAIVGFIVALIVTAFAGRSRVRSVRLAMLARAAAARRAVS